MKEQKTLPHIEFIQGISDLLGDDFCFDQKRINAIWLDAMMSSATKSQIIKDLFIEGFIPS